MPSEDTKSKPTLKLVNVSNLHFDPENPRFPKNKGKGISDKDSFDLLVKTELIEDLATSIVENGYIPGENLLVIPFPGKESEYIVVEGNRRLAALKILNKEIQTSKKSLQEIVDNARDIPSAVDCLVFNNRKDVLPYLGYRHITGTKRWEPMAKARYVASLINELYHDFPLNERYKKAAADIGSKSHYVKNMLTSLRLYDDAIEKDFYKLQGLSEADIQFSLISTALGYNNICDFIGITKNDPDSIKNIKPENWKRLLSWLFKQDQNGDTVIPESRQLRLLDEIVDPKHTLALEKLKETQNLFKAHEFTKDHDTLFQNSLADANESIKNAHKYMQEYDILLDHSDIDRVENIIESCQDLRLLIQRRLDKSKESPKD